MYWQDYLLIGLVFWLVILTSVSIWIFFYFRRLSKGVNKDNLLKVLDNVLGDQQEVSKSLIEIKKQVLEFETQGKVHFQKLGLVRFNPFKEMGGDHSFSLAMLDGNDSGFVITGLHSRDRTRVYMKNIKKGKSDLELSNEEKKALVLAQKRK